MWKRFNITVPEEYEKDGQTKTIWHNVGEVAVRDSDNKVFVKIPLLNGGKSMPAFIREDKEKQERNEDSQETGHEEPAVQYPDEEIDPDDIPF